MPEKELPPTEDFRALLMDAREKRAIYRERMKQALREVGVDDDDLIQFQFAIVLDQKWGFTWREDRDHYETACLTLVNEDEGDDRYIVERWRGGFPIFRGQRYVAVLATIVDHNNFDDETCALDKILVFLDRANEVKVDLPPIKKRV